MNCLEERKLYLIFFASLGSTITPAGTGTIKESTESAISAGTTSKGDVTTDEIFFTSTFRDVTNITADNETYLAGWCQI